ncbi:MAG: hypothetical protein COB35_12225 [Gammaproteobacteria bacterium]|nr:MAG: hypothetical protein COB35_12225 [Gammaproteobacteria bacterium]
MRFNSLFVIGLLLITLYSLPILAGGGGGGGSGGSGSSVPFLHPLFNIVIFMVISFFYHKKNK